MAKIKVKLKCDNIAPLESLDNEFENNSLKIGVFANNGSGKTFISRMFRLLERNTEGSDSSLSPDTDRLITLGKKSASFRFRITNDSGIAVEDITINIAIASNPVIPATRYLYHTFNQDYVDDNIRTLDYEHSDDVQGYILGKTNIDLTDDNKKLAGIISDRASLKEDITQKIDSYILKHIAPIANIRRLGEYQQFVSADIFLAHGDTNKQALSKSFDEYVADYDKVKSIPENLADIDSISAFDFSLQQYSEIQQLLSTTYTLSSFGESFKDEMRAKQDFVERGLSLVKTSEGRCPFCKQIFGADALSLIDQYNDFITNEEAKTIKRIQDFVQFVETKRKELTTIKSKTIAVINRYNDYKTKYIPSCEGKSLIDLDIHAIDGMLVALKDALEKKHKDISTIVDLTTEARTFEVQVLAFNNTVKDNNDLITEINSKKNSIGEESKDIRRNICKAAYNHWIDKYGKDQKRYVEFGKREEELNNQIEKKKAAQKVEKKKLVAETIKNVLNYFFAGKYTLDENTFRLVFQSKTLEKNQTKNVLSEGEKNIVAFAYYLGDTHTVIEKEDDYKRLFFIIDDPISSMDFTYVYTLSGVIRDIKSLFPKMDTSDILS